MYFWSVFIELILLFYTLFPSVLCVPSEILSNFSIIPFQQNAESSNVVPKLFNSVSQQNIFDQQPQRQGNKPQGIQDLEKLQESIKNFKIANVDSWNSLISEFEIIIRKKEWKIDTVTDLNEVFASTFKTISLFVDAYDRLFPLSPKVLHNLQDLIEELPAMYQTEFSKSDIYDIYVNNFDPDTLEVLIISNSRGNRPVKKISKKFKNIEIDFEGEETVNNDCFISIVILNKVEKIFKWVPPGNPLVYVSNPCGLSKNRPKGDRWETKNRLNFRFLNTIPISRVERFSILPIAVNLGQAPRSLWKNVGGFNEFTWGLDTKSFTLSNEKPEGEDPTPSVTTSSVTTPSVTTPSVTTPSVTTPSVTTPSVTTPSATTLSVTTSSVRKSSVSTLSVPTPIVPKPIVPKPNVPKPSDPTSSFTTDHPLEDLDNLNELNSPVDSIADAIKKLQIIYESLTVNISKSDFEHYSYKTEMLLQEIVDNPETIQRMKLEDAVQISDIAFSIVDQFISIPIVWQSNNDTLITESAGRIFNIMSLLAEIMNIKIDKNLVYETRKENIFSRTERFEYIVNSSLTFNLSDQSLRIELVVPFKSLNFTEEPEVTIQTNVSGTFTAILKDPTNEFLDVGNEKVNTNIFALVLERKSFLVDEFYFRIRHKEKLQFGDESVCSFWNRSSLTWMSTGCRLDEDQSNRTVSVCYCSHTTNFAALMDVSNREINETPKFILTSVCSTLTIIAAGLAMYLPYRYPRRRQIERDKHGEEQKRFVIIQNLCGTVIVSHLFIMFGMGRTESPGVCVLSAILLFFFLLATFVFMFLMLSFFFVNSSDYTFRLIGLESKHFLYVGYSLPGAIVVLSVGVIFAQSQDLSKDLCGEYFCWIASKKRPNNLWFFVVPVVLITIINCFLTGLLFQRWWEMKQQEQEKVDLRRVLITFGFFTLTYGLPWLLFVFYINRKLSSFAYVFILINGSHGVMLLYNQAEVYWNELKIDYDELKKKLRKEDSTNTFLPKINSNLTVGAPVEDSNTTGRNSDVKMKQSGDLEKVREPINTDLNLAPWP